MNKSESIAALSAALSKAQGELKSAPKDSVNPFFKSKYADINSVWDACRAALSKNGLAVIQLPSTDDGGRVSLECVLSHSSGEWISTTATVIPKTGTPQDFGSAITYLRRYTLSAMVGVVADDDDDGNGSSVNHRGDSQVHEVKPTMTLQQALDTASSDGTLYGALGNDKLLLIANNVKTPAEKKTAAQLILKSRAENKPA